MSEHVINRARLRGPRESAAFVGWKLGEFAPTRRFRGHGDKTEKGSRVR